MSEALTQIKTKKPVTVDSVAYGVGKTLVVATDRARRLADAGYAEIVRDVVVNPVEPAKDA